MADRADVAVVGTGRMGGAMAGTLARAGLSVIVWNRTREKAAAVADAVGADVADSAAAAAAAAPVIVSSLADDRAVVAAYRSDDGLLAGLQAGAVVLETSTIDPQTVRELAPEVASTGATLLDAPVSGSVSLVEQGALTIMVGGPAEAMAPADAVLDALSSRVFHIGETGTGATMKLAVNAVVHAINATVSEALVLAEAGGIDRGTAYEVFAAGAGGAPFVQYKREAFQHPDEAPVAFSLELVAKDLELITALGERLGVPLAQARTNHVLADEAIAAGLGDRDMSALAVHLRQRSRQR